MFAADFGRIRKVEWRIARPPRRLNNLDWAAGDALGSEGGVRMTGGGFGGAVVSVLPAEAVAGVCAAIHTKYRAPDGKPAEIMIERAAHSAAGGME